MTVDYEHLIEPDRVHGSLYTDPAIFAEEMTRIFATTWVCLGHDSEIPQPGDYIRRHLGRDEVVVTRAKDGEIHVLLNRCAHRANLVCEDDQGNSNSFRCPYHGWTYGNDGELLGYPYFKGYGGKGKLDLRLGSAARVDTYQGFIFASMAAEGPTLIEHLGPAAGEMDRLAALSPTGEIELTGTWMKHRARANWKMLVENETDGYHPQFVHGSIISVSGHALGHLYSEKSKSVVRALGNGHSELDQREEFRHIDKPLMWFDTTPERLPDYVAQMREKHGEDTDRLLIDGAPHVMVYPNLFIAEVTIFLIEPVGVDETIQHSTPVQFKGSPDINRRLISQSMASVGPAGMLLADDTEMYERNQAGVQASQPEWLVLKRGLDREWVDDDGLQVGVGNDETAMRAFWSHYRTVMTDDEPSTSEVSQ
ncbi:dioxygenase hydroxylase component [Rhodococcus sp. B7740]|uniref:aromatic ring-hydroxylating oxygenase subunit alpha n=1 Tax=Rhodococcus sp. B7740 TaxID=1564114 RepID=UPI0005D936E1|nr:aromatic ring-hydroxylating dioxygenase subunit alpha [Rhodococcus sp. B7740]AJW40307.1 dioxygenase hydroxylase component [Rhodococcus sp. B7740]